MYILINGWFSGQATTGSGQYLHHLLVHLPRQSAGVQFSVLVPQELANQSATALGEQWPGVTVLIQSLPPLPTNLAKLWWEQVTMPLAAKQLQTDCLWTPYWAAPLWQPCPSVVTVHDLIPALLPAYRGGLLNRLYTALVSLTARRTQAVITVSQASARNVVAHLHIPANRVHAVLHGPNQEGEALVDATALARVRQQYKLPARFFLYLGGFDLRKNLRTTLTAYQRYLARGGDPAVKLVIAGQLPAQDSAFAPDPRHIAAELKLGDQVYCCGWVDEVDKPALYTLSTAFIFPSLYEGFGMMVLEAMRAGTPVVTSR